MPRYVKHGGCKSPEYRSWIEMRRRCRDTTRHNYYLYGARGIKVCARWKNFETFLEDMGHRPTLQHSIDRINSNGHYSPSNCRWATSKEQTNNRRSNRIVSYCGTRISLSSALSMAGDVVKKDTARLRLERGWSVADAVETPPDSRFGNRNRKTS